MSNFKQILESYFAHSNNQIIQFKDAQTFHYFKISKELQWYILLVEEQIAQNDFVPEQSEIQKKFKSQEKSPYQQNKSTTLIDFLKENNIDSKFSDSFSKAGFLFVIIETTIQQENQLVEIIKLFNLQSGLRKSQDNEFQRDLVYSQQQNYLNQENMQETCWTAEVKQIINEETEHNQKDTQECERNNLNPYFKPGHLDMKDIFKSSEKGLPHIIDYFLWHNFDLQRFIFLDYIGEGSYGDVFLVKNTLNGKEFVLKQFQKDDFIFQENDDNDQIQQYKSKCFEQEKQFYTNLYNNKDKYSKVFQFIICVDEDLQQYFKEWTYIIGIPFTKGEFTLSDLINIKIKLQHQGWSSDEIRYIRLFLISAQETLIQNEIYHYDLKPDNLVFIRSIDNQQDNKYQMKMIDLAGSASNPSQFGAHTQYYMPLQLMHLIKKINIKRKQFNGERTQKLNCQKAQLFMIGRTLLFPLVDFISKFSKNSVNKYGKIKQTQLKQNISLTQIYKKMKLIKNVFILDTNMNQTRNELIDIFNMMLNPTKLAINKAIKQFSLSKIEFKLDNEIKKNLEIYLKQHREEIYQKPKNIKKIHKLNFLKFTELIKEVKPALYEQKRIEDLMQKIELSSKQIQIQHESIRQEFKDYWQQMNLVFSIIIFYSIEHPVSEQTFNNIITNIIESFQNKFNLSELSANYQDNKMNIILYILDQNIQYLYQALPYDFDLLQFLIFNSLFKLYALDKLNLSHRKRAVLEQLNQINLDKSNYSWTSCVNFIFLYFLTEIAKVEKQQIDQLKIKILKVIEIKFQHQFQEKKFIDNFFFIVLMLLISGERNYAYYRNDEFYQKCEINQLFTNLVEMYILHLGTKDYIIHKKRKSIQEFILWILLTLSKLLPGFGFGTKIIIFTDLVKSNVLIDQIISRSERWLGYLGKNGNIQRIDLAIVLKHKIGNLYSQKQNFEKELQYQQETLLLVQEHYPECKIMSLHLNIIIGQIYVQKQSYENALETFNQCLDQIFSNLYYILPDSIYQQNKEIADGKAQCESMFCFCINPLREQLTYRKEMLISDIYCNIAFCFQNMRQIKKATKYYMNSINNSRISQGYLIFFYNKLADQKERCENQQNSQLKQFSQILILMNDEQFKEEIKNNISFQFQQQTYKKEQFKNQMQDQQPLNLLIKQEDERIYNKFYEVIAQHLQMDAQIKLQNKEYKYSKQSFLRTQQILDKSENRQSNQEKKYHIIIDLAYVYQQLSEYKQAYKLLKDLLASINITKLDKQQQQPDQVQIQFFLFKCYEQLQSTCDKLEEYEESEYYGNEKIYLQKLSQYNQLKLN